MHGPPARYPDPRRLLAAIAHVYGRRQGLRKPARVVYRHAAGRHPAAGASSGEPTSLPAGGLPAGSRAARPDRWRNEAGRLVEETDWGLENCHLRIARITRWSCRTPRSACRYSPCSAEPPPRSGGRLEAGGRSAARRDAPQASKISAPGLAVQFEPGGFTVMPAT